MAHRTVTVCRPCLDCGSPTEHTRCTWCQTARQRQRNYMRRDIYNTGHRHLREAWASAVATGTVLCARCPELIHPGDTWHLDHLDDGTEAPSHAHCNTSARRNPT